MTAGFKPEHQQQLRMRKDWCITHGANDRSTAETVARYFEDTWKGDVTEANWDAAFDQLKPYLKFYEVHKQETYGLLSKLSPEEQKAFNEWTGPRGLKPTYRAMVALLARLCGHKLL